MILHVTISGETPEAQALLAGRVEAYAKLLAIQNGLEVRFETAEPAPLKKLLFSKPS